MEKSTTCVLLDVGVSWALVHSRQERGASSVQNVKVVPVLDPSAMN